MPPVKLGESALSPPAMTGGDERSTATELVLGSGGKGFGNHVTGKGRRHKKREKK